MFDHALLLDNQELSISAHLGVARYAQDDVNIEGLISKADMAMYHAKTLAKSGYHLYQDHMLARIQEKETITHLVKKGLKDQGFRLAYQPQHHLRDDTITGFEALIRMDSAGVSPARLIQVAEEIGQIETLGRWVISQVIGQVAQWQAQGLTLPPVAINFSVHQLSDETITAFI